MAIYIKKEIFFEKNPIIITPNYYICINKNKKPKYIKTL